MCIRDSITHNRPEFRLEDWTYYRKVNEKFADALLEEIAGEESPIILVQDYHLALLPSLIKEKRPDAKVAIFWHIPWPNPEAYGICPWRQEILQGMLGSDIIGFGHGMCQKMATFASGRFSLINDGSRAKW